jgi:DNA-binding CsgD family transcriptional regulator
MDALVRESRLEAGAGIVELRAEATGLPATLTTAIGHRLGFLSPRAMSALQMAAVLGPVFSVADLSTVTGQPASEFSEVVAEALSAGVLAESARATLAFRHGLVHQTLYQGMPASLRAALHRQAAGSLAEAGRQPQQVAAQLMAGPPEADPWMIDWVAGAAPMLSHGAPRLTATLLERARDGLGGQDPRHEQLDLHLAMARLMLGDNEQVVLLAQPILESTRDPAMAGRAAWILAYALPRLGRPEQAIEVADRALARDGLPPVWSARLRARRATSLFAVGRYDAARAEAERAEAEGTQAGDRLAAGYALYTLARLEIIGRRSLTAARDPMERALAVLRDEPQATDLVLQLMTNLGGILRGLGLPAEADPIFVQIAALVEHGTRPRQAYVRAFGAVHAFDRGQWDDALAELDAAAQLTPDATYRQYLSGIAAQVAVHRDDREAADAYLRGVEDIPLSDSAVRLEVEFLLVAWALAAERDADPAEALTRLLAIFAPDATLKFPRLGVNSTKWLPEVVRLALTVGEPTVAAAATEACAQESGAQPDLLPLKAGVEHCQGLLDGDPAAVRTAAEMFQSFEYPLFSAQALENAAVLYAEQGDDMEARAAHRQAVGIYSGLGAVWDIRRADARLRLHGIRRGTQRTRPRPVTGWESLTPTEQKIAHLVAGGQSNPDIAAQMFLSRHTVQTHVSHILTKLNAKSRAEIAREAAERSSRHDGLAAGIG